MIIYAACFKKNITSLKTLLTSSKISIDIQKIMLKFTVYDLR